MKWLLIEMARLGIPYYIYSHLGQPGTGNSLLVLFGCHYFIVWLSLPDVLFFCLIMCFCYVFSLPDVLFICVLCFSMCFRCLMSFSFVCSSFLLCLCLCVSIACFPFPVVCTYCTMFSLTCCALQAALLKTCFSCFHWLAGVFCFCRLLYSSMSSCPWIPNCHTRKPKHQHIIKAFSEQ